MSKRQWLTIFGILVIVAPFLGVPDSWKTIASVVLGVLVVAISYTVRPSLKGPKTNSAALPYSEHNNAPKKAGVDSVSVPEKINSDSPSI